MKRSDLLIVLFASCGVAKADDMRGHQDVIQDPMAHQGRDNSPINERSAGVIQANGYIDVIFLERMPNFVRETPDLYPSAPLYPFTFKVDKTAITNRDLKVNVTSGELKNFDTAVRRLGDCEPGEDGGNATITCTLSIEGITAEVYSVTKGDSLLGTVKSVNVQAVVSNTTGIFDFTKARHLPGYVRNFFVQRVSFDVTPGDNLDLNDIRMSNFKSYIANYLREELLSNLYGSYKRLLDIAFR